VIRSNLASLNERGLLAAIRAGRQDGLDELARRHASAVRALLRRMGCDPAAADDLTQEAFIIAFRRLGELREEGSFAGWLKRIAARLYLRRVTRRKGFEVSLDLAPEQAGPMPEPGLLIDLDQALRRLSDLERLGVTLCHGAGLSHGEVAEALGLPLGTVKSGIKRGLDKLRLHMDSGLPRAANG
jgi:RNA polymerase sigma factor (sigma-70 family)